MAAEPAPASPTRTDAVEQGVAAGRLDEALAALQALVASHAPEHGDEAALLSGQWQRLRRDERGGLVGTADAEVQRTRLAARILALRRELPAAAAASAAAPAVAPARVAPSAPTSRPVFISYNHADAEAATALRAALHEAGIGAHIDAEQMQPGEDIAGFIRRSVAGTAATLCLVSRASLLSGWVAQETLLALGQQQLADRRFIALFLDDGFLAPEARLELTDSIDARLAHLQGLRQAHEARALDTIDLDAAIARLRGLRNGLGAVLQALRGTLCLDFRLPARAATLPRLLSSLTGQG